MKTVIEWYPTSEPPEYQVQAGGIETAFILIAHKDGVVFPGLYLNGKFFIFELDIECPHVTHWAYFPKHPEKE